MSTPTDPAPSAAEVKERLKKVREYHLRLAQDDSCFPHEAEKYQEQADTLTAAIALIERGELERERMCLRVETGEFSDNCPFCLAKHNSPGLPNPMCHLCDLESERDNNRAQLAAATERVKQLEAGLRETQDFIWKNNDEASCAAYAVADRLLEGTKHHIAARAPKEGTP